MLHFDCPHCGKQIRLKVEFAGRRGSCPHCKNPIQAPAVQPRATEPEPEPEPVASPLGEIYDEGDAAAEPVMARGAPKAKSKKKQSNSMPLVIGGGVAVAAAVIGVVVWFATRGSSSAPEKNSVAQNTTQQPNSGGAQPNASQPNAGPANAAQTAPATPTQTPSKTAGQSAAATDMLVYLPPGLDAIAGVRVAEALQADHKVHVRAQLDSALRPALARIGLTLDQLEDVVIGSGTKDGMLILAVRGIKPLDAAAVRASLGCTAAPQKINQLDAYPLAPEPGAAESVACFLDSRTLVVGTKDLVQKAIETPGSGKPSPTLSAVKDLSGVKTHVWLVARMSVLKSQVSQLSELGLASSMFAPAVEKVGEVAMGFDLTKDMQLRLALECDSESNAKAMKTTADVMRIALRDFERKMVAESRAPSGGGATGRSGGPPSSPTGGPGGAGGPTGGPTGGPGGGPGGMPGAPGGGRPGGGMPGAPGGSPGASGGSEVGAVWDKTEVKQTGNQVLVTLPPVTIEGDRGASPLELFGSAAQASFARTAIGSSLFPGPLRRSSLALRGIEQKEGSLPAGTVIVEKLKRPGERLSWMTALLPHLGHQDLYNQIDLNGSWTDEKNIPAAVTIVEEFLDPLVTKRRWKGYPMEGVALTHFVGMAGVGPESPRLAKEHPKAGIFGYDRKTAVTDIRDGAANTILMIQANDVYGPWVQGGGATVRAAQSPPYIGVTGGFGSPGPRSGAMTIFADGSVRFLSKDIDPSVFEALCTMNGGEQIDLSKIAPPQQTAGK